MEEAFSKVKELLRRAKVSDVGGYFKQCGYRTPQDHSL